MRTRARLPSANRRYPEDTLRSPRLSFPVARLFQSLGRVKKLLVAALLLGACANAPERRLPPPAHLSQTARDLLYEGMRSHGDDMTDLLWATLFLDDASVLDIADHLRAAPRFARPLTQDAAELNSQLPREFFELQDELGARAGTLAEAARRQDSQGMAAAYGALTQTCVRCHSLYLNAEPHRLE
jgi:hypothetical protein